MSEKEEPLKKDLVERLNSLNLEWSETVQSFEHFARRFRIPQPIAIKKGEDGNSRQQFFAWKKRNRFKVQAQCFLVRSGEKRSIGPVFGIPDDYEGWFEIVSEQGQVMSTIQKVSTLARFRRKCFMLMKSMHAHQRSLEGNWFVCTLHIGYKLTVGGILSDIVALPNCGCGKLLRCESSGLLQEASETIYLPVNSSGRFSLLSGDKLSGPQTISCFKALRFPINVKLMEGSPHPSNDPRLPHSMCLIREVFEEVLTCWSLRTDDPLVNIPFETPMELRVLKNLRHVLQSPLYKEIMDQIRYLRPKRILKETYEIPDTAWTSDEPGTSISYDYNLVTRYFFGWLSPSKNAPSEYRSYPQSSVSAATHGENVVSLETGSVKTCSAQPTSGHASFSKATLSNYEGEKAKDEPRNSISFISPRRLTVDHRSDEERYSNDSSSSSDHSIVMEPVETSVVQPRSRSVSVEKGKENLLNIICEEVKDEPQNRISYISLSLGVGHRSDEERYSNDSNSSVDHVLSMVKEPVETSVVQPGSVSAEKENPIDMENEKARDEPQTHNQSFLETRGVRRERTCDVESNNRDSDPVETCAKASERQVSVEKESILNIEFKKTRNELQVKSPNAHETRVFNPKHTSDVELTCTDLDPLKDLVPSMMTEHSSKKPSTYKAKDDPMKRGKDQPLPNISHVKVSQTRRLRSKSARERTQKISKLGADQSAKTRRSLRIKSPQQRNDHLTSETSNTRNTRPLNIKPQKAKEYEDRAQLDAYQSRKIRRSPRIKTPSSTPVRNDPQTSKQSTDESNKIRRSLRIKTSPKVDDLGIFRSMFSS